MLFGQRSEEVVHAIERIGFAITDRLTVLGCEIRETIEETVAANVEKMERKVSGQIAKWLPLRLSLVGRIAVSKTFLASQITFAGSIFEIPAAVSERVQGRIDGYALGGMPFSREKLYTPAHWGGLGLLNISSLLTAMKTTWIRRILQKGAIDGWRYNILKQCFFNVGCIRPYLFAEASTMEKVIINNYWKCTVAWWEGEGGVQNSPLFYNPLVLRGRDAGGRKDSREITADIIGVNIFKQREEMLLLLRVRDFNRGGRVADFATMDNLLGGGITQNCYWSIWRAFDLLLQNRANRIASEEKNWLTTVSKSNRGSRVFRKILDAKKKVDKSEAICRKFANNVGIAMPEMLSFRGWTGFWSNGYLPVGMRLFSFQMVNNCLPVKSRLSHRPQYININQGCDFCLTGAGARCRETFKHVFFECEPVLAVLAAFERKYCNAGQLRNHMLFGLDINGNYDEVYNLIYYLLLYNIWNSRIHSKRIGWLTIEENMLLMFGAIIRSNKRLENLITVNNNLWCRHWCERHGHGRG